MDDSKLRDMAVRIASTQVAGKKKKSKKKPARTSLSQHGSKTEYSCHSEISFSVDFEGTVPRASLMRKLENEVLSALKTSINIVSKEMDLDLTSLNIVPVRMECAVIDPEDDTLDGGMDGQDAF